MLFSKKCAIGLILLLLVLVACVPILIANSWQQERRHFRAVREGVFYRSGQMTLKGLSRSVHDHGIKSVVTFRASNRSDKPNPDAEEENWCKGEGLKYLRLAPLHWQDSEGGAAPVEENLKKYLDFLLRTFQAVKFGKEAKNLQKKTYFIYIFLNLFYLFNFLYLFKTIIFFNQVY